MTALALTCADNAPTPVRFDRKKYFPADEQTRTAEFLSLFHRYGYIYKPLTAGGSWLSAKEQWTLTDSEVLKAIACAHPRYLLGARAGKTARFAVLDIDTKSQYHKKKELHRLIATLTDAGLTEPCLYQSSDSGGWHLYIYLDEPVPSLELHRLLVQLLQCSGFTVKKGTLEVFPNPGDGSLGYGLRLPLQPGFAWVNSNTLDIETEREWLTPSQALERFMADCRHFNNSPTAYAQLKRTVKERVAAHEQIAEHINQALGQSTRHIEAANELAAAAVSRVFGKLPPGMIADIWWRGRSYFESGLTGPSQRADAIFCLNHYLFYGDPEKQLEPLGYGYEEERRYAIESILAAKNHDQSKDLNRGRPDAVAQISRAANWRPPHKRADNVVPFKRSVPIAWVRHNGNLKADAISRIRKAVCEFVEAKQPFTVRELALKAECSTSTLYCHKALWQPLQQELRRRLTAVSDEYNAVVGAGGQETGTLPQDYVEDMPPGRLACRQIVFELLRRKKPHEQEHLRDIESISKRYAHSWKSKLAAALPADLASCDARRLKTSLPILVALLAGAPDEEQQISLQREVQIIRQRLAELRESFAVTAVQALELDC